ncbi:MAG: hypothetical protein O3A48_04140 [Actinomycetota bacterium]|nr:hypothetical protein [Actinomycetota bacterium]MDA3013708.1 hypothetical protein [Actinomycetota bacterium]
MNYKLGILGWPLKRTYSPIIHSFLASICNLSIEYEKIVVNEINKTFLKDINKNFDGYNITVPFKSLIYKLINEESSHELDEDSHEIKAINTVCNLPDNLIATNTDIIGINQTVQSFDLDFVNKNILILGSGGTSKMLQYMFSVSNNIHVASRQNDENTIQYSQIDSIADEIDVLINTTPIGMPPYADQTLPIPHEKFKNLQVFFSLGYGSNIFTNNRFEKNVLCVDGLTMLIAQAIASFNIWTSKGVIFDDVFNKIKERLSNEN